MTIVFSAASSDFIVMANDSIVVLDFEHSPREYTKGRKWYARSGSGCVTMWGARDGNQLVRHLSELPPESMLGTTDLVMAVNHYLTTDFAPHDHGLGDTGFHIGGFTPDGRPLLFHAFYNVPGSPGAFESRGAYCLQDQSPGEAFTRFLYNGRHDLAEAPLALLLGELNAGHDLDFPKSPDGYGRLAHFILRFASELSREVGPPFLMHLIEPGNRVKTTTVDTLNRLEPGYFDKAWSQVAA
jgi:hypothetical protein